MLRATTIGEKCSKRCWSQAEGIPLHRWSDRERHDSHRADRGRRLCDGASARAAESSARSCVRSTFRRARLRLTHRDRRRAARPVDGQRMIFVGTHIDIAIPPIDITTVVSKPEDFGSASTGALRPDGVEPQTRDYGSPFRADQVDRQVGLIPGARPPAYPEALRGAGIEGKCWWNSVDELRSAGAGKHSVGAIRQRSLRGCREGCARSAALHTGRSWRKKGQATRSDAVRIHAQPIVSRYKRLNTISLILNLAGIPPDRC